MRIGKDAEPVKGRSINRKNIRVLWENFKMYKYAKRSAEALPESKNNLYHYCFIFTYHYWKVKAVVHVPCLLHCKSHVWGPRSNIRWVVGESHDGDQRNRPNNVLYKAKDESIHLVPYTNKKSSSPIASHEKEQI